MTEPTPEPHLYDRSDMWKAIDRFTNPTRPLLTRDDHTTEHVEIPSLWEQLVDAMESGAGGSGHGEQESKPPVDTAALSLVIEIANEIRATVSEWNNPEAPAIEQLKRSRDNCKDLRMIGSAAIRLGPTHVNWLADKVKGWNGKIRAVCSSDIDRPTRLHGMACQDCGAKSVLEPSEHGETVRGPAIVVHWRDRLVRAVECRCCGKSWFRGPDLDRLTEQMQPTTDRRTA